jgi:DNA-binding transcriptional ArsR family regulator
MANKNGMHDGTPTSAGASSHRGSDRAIRDAVQVFRLLSDESRLRILLYLVKNDELNVTELCNRLGQGQPAVSHHLALLRVSGLIEPRREGKHNYYRVRPEAFGALILALMSESGEPPKRLKFHDFLLSYQPR